MAMTCRTSGSSSKSNRSGLMKVTSSSYSGTGRCRRGIFLPQAGSVYLRTANLAVTIGSSASWKKARMLLNASRVRLVIALLGLGMIAVPGAVSGADDPPGDAATAAVASAQAPDPVSDDDTTIRIPKTVSVEFLFRCDLECDERGALSVVSVCRSCGEYPARIGGI
jgi:hypothetical protein